MSVIAFLVLFHTVPTMYNNFTIFSDFFRQELNNLKTAHVQTQRYVSDQESQRKHLEARLHAEMETHSRYVQTLQGQIQYHSSRAQSLQHSLDSLSAQQVNQVIEKRKISLKRYFSRPVLSCNRNGN